MVLGNFFVRPETDAEPRLSLWLANPRGGQISPGDMIDGGYTGMLEVARPGYNPAWEKLPAGTESGPDSVLRAYPQSDR